MDINPLTFASSSLVAACLAVLTLFGVDGIDQSPATWLGLAAVALTGFLGVIQLYLNGKFNLREAKLQMRLEQMEKSEAECRTRADSMQVELTALRVSKPATVTGFYVYAGLDEIIVDVTDGVRDVLGYRPVELINEKIDTLIPQSVRAQHHAGVVRAKEKGLMRAPNTAIKTQARHKSGQALDVIVSLDGDTRKGVNVVRAEVMLRGGIIE